jgi:hypothetical protein
VSIYLSGLQGSSETATPGFISAAVFLSNSPSLPTDLQAMSSRATFGARPAVRVGGRRAAAPAARLNVRAEATTKIERASVPLELEKGELPMNTFSPKKPFKATVKSVKVITGPGATGETCDVVIDTRGEIPYWEGQSYGVIPPVSQSSAHSCSYLHHKAPPPFQAGLYDAPSFK